MQGSRSPSNNVLPRIEDGAGSGGMLSWTDIRPDARVVAVQHPRAALAPETVLQRAEAVVERLSTQLVTAH
jgi:hypothetical protein